MCAHDCVCVCVSICLCVCVCASVYVHLCVCDKPTHRYPFVSPQHCNDLAHPKQSIIIIITIILRCPQQAQQVEDSNQSDSDEEPSPEALARYLAMRRHTVGVGDARHESPEDARAKLAHNQPLIANPRHPHFGLAPFGQLPETNLPQHIPMATATAALPHHPFMAVYDHNLLQLPTTMAQGLARACVCVTLCVCVCV